MTYSHHSNFAWYSSTMVLRVLHPLIGSAIALIGGSQAHSKCARDWFQLSTLRLCLAVLQAFPRFCSSLLCGGIFVCVLLVGEKGYRHLLGVKFGFVFWEFLTCFLFWSVRGHHVSGSFFMLYCDYFLSPYMCAS
jgi:hypothetical protein